MRRFLFAAHGTAKRPVGSRTEQAEYLFTGDGVGRTSDEAKIDFHQAAMRYFLAAMPLDQGWHAHTLTYISLVSDDTVRCVYESMEDA